MEAARTVLRILLGSRQKSCVSLKTLPESQLRQQALPAVEKGPLDRKILTYSNTTCRPTPMSMPVYGTGESFNALLHLPSEHERLSMHHIQVDTGAVPVAVILGGYHGPSSIYEEIGARLASVPQGVPVLRVDFRRAGHVTSCVEDIWSAMTHLRRLYLVSNFVLVGWNFGAAPVFAVAAQEIERVIGCATIASQWNGTQAVGSLKPRPLLLLHGTADQTCIASTSEALYDAYGSGGDRRIHLFEGDNHVLSNSRAEAIDLICAFTVKCASIYSNKSIAETS